MAKNNEIFRSEFIGKNTNVVGKNIHGKIIDETKNTILIKTNSGKKIVQKENNTFEIEINNGLYTIDGKSILMKPEDRIKIK